MSDGQGTGKAFQPTSVVRGAASAESQDCGPTAVPMRALSGLQLVFKTEWGLLMRAAHTEAGTCLQSGKLAALSLLDQPSYGGSAWRSTAGVHCSALRRVRARVFAGRTQCLHGRPPAVMRCLADVLERELTAPGSASGALQDARHRVLRHHAALQIWLPPRSPFDPCSSSSQALAQVGTFLTSSTDGCTCPSYSTSARHQHITYRLRLKDPCLIAGMAKLEWPRTLAVAAPCASQDRAVLSLHI